MVVIRHQFIVITANQAVIFCGKNGPRLEFSRVKTKSWSQDVSRPSFQSLGLVLLSVLNK